MEPVHKQIIISEIDKHLLKEYTWWLSHGRPQTKIRINGIVKNKYLHHFILPKKEGFVVDHINHNKLDNRRCNLRYATPSQNCLNQSICKNNTSGYRGVNWHKKSKKWRVYIYFQGKQRCFGQYDDILKASRVYKKNIKKLFKNEIIGDITK